MLYQQLSEAKPELFEIAAQGWRRWKDAVEDEQVRFETRVVTPLCQPEIWWGSSAAVARPYLQDLLQAQHRAVDEMERVPGILREFAGELAACQRVLDGIRARAASCGFGIDPSGAVLIPPGMPLPPGATAQSVTAGAERLAAEITSLLRRATAAEMVVVEALGSFFQQVVAPAVGGAGLPAIPGPHTSPQQVDLWWDGLTAGQQAELIEQRPAEIGALNGVPVEARDAANRLVLAALPGSRDRIAELRGLGESRSDAQTAELQRLEGIEAVRTRLQSTELPRAYLLGFDPAGNGKAIVAVGNPDIADNVVTYVPGTGAGLRSVPTDLKRADVMVEEAGRLDPGSSTSAITWIGYEAPQEVANVPGSGWPGEGDAMDPGFAERAGAPLDAFQEGLRVTHQGPPSHNTVLGHSYGSTVVGHAASDHDLPVDDVIFVGSPGVGVDSAAELGLDQGQVWSSHAANDPIQYGYDVGDVLGPVGITDGEPGFDLVHGRNPSDPAFGGRRFTSDPGAPVVSVDPGPWYAPWETDVGFSMDAHSQYWDARSASLENMALIITDNDGWVR
ncbi:MAG: alpha/beta hydrolase [Pseudonocardiaceae bacterium]